ncbi:hypothetical protein [uncultured Mediterranean phage]|nr:hypothetical protein [uncultured Mediterranean phage]
MKFTKQQTFNKIGKHLLTQLEVASSGTMCRYRADYGLMCAAGAIIPDDEYTEEMEGNAVNHIHSPTLRKHDLFTVTRLQEIHDNALGLDDDDLHIHWSAELFTYACDHRLSIRWITHLLYATPNEAS